MLPWHKLIENILRVAVMFAKKCTSLLRLGLLSAVLGLLAFLYFSVVRADQDLISLFPIENYNQNLNEWIKRSDPAYDKPLLNAEMQQHHIAVLYDHYFGSYSPWDRSYVNQILHKATPDDLFTIEQTIIQLFNNANNPASAIGYGENFRPYTQEWLNTLINNIDPNQLKNLSYQVENRAIAIDNLNARALPTDDVFLYSYKLPGNGYPFDNLQMSSIWGGTPLYILCETRDHRWSLVITPEFIGWVKSTGLARADENFISTWKTAAKKNLAAITHSETPLVDETGQFRLTAYVGAFFPGEPGPSEFKLMVPVADAEHHALIKYSHVPTEAAVLMPLTATPQHFSQIMSTLIGRPYGWGGMYFYNDCSAELKNLLTPFGIWLPRHSSDQVYAGKLVDMSAAPANQRLAYLTGNGHPFLTLIYIGGHIMLYIGNYPNPNDKDHAAIALTYQDMWGLSPNPPTRRAVVGKAVLFPLLLQYPEDKSLTSLASKKYFQVAYLDQLPNYQIKLETIDLKALMNSR